MCCKHCIHYGTVADSCSGKKKSTFLWERHKREWKRIYCYNEMAWSFTSVSCWKMTTRPPLSPVASSSPEWLNSTVEMMSAVGRAETETSVRFLPPYDPPQKYIQLIHLNSHWDPAKNTLCHHKLMCDFLQTHLASKVRESLTDSSRWIFK